MIRVFQVDTGLIVDLSISDMVECKMEIIQQLPLHAARCSLAEVGPFDKDWYSEVGDRLFDFTSYLTDEAMFCDGEDGRSV